MLYKRSVLKNVSKFTDKHKKPRCSVKRKDVLKNFAKVTENIFSGVSFYIKLQAENLKPSEAVTGDVL